VHKSSWLTQGGLLICYDLQNDGNKDLSLEGYKGRYHSMKKLLSSLEKPVFQLIKNEVFSSWDQLRDARFPSLNAPLKGMLLRFAEQKLSANREDVVWAFNPIIKSVKGVLTYVGRDTRTRNAPFTEFTFGLWNAGQLVTFTKAPTDASGFNDSFVQRFIQENQIQRFGPVTEVYPQLVFEVRFEEVVPSKRHKCGFKLIGPSILRFSKELKPEDADSLEVLQSYV
jgi:DNA ligase-1